MEISLLICITNWEKINKQKPTTIIHNTTQWFMFKVYVSLPGRPCCAWWWCCDQAPSWRHSRQFQCSERTSPSRRFLPQWFSQFRTCPLSSAPSFFSLSLSLTLPPFPCKPRSITRIKLHWQVSSVICCWLVLVFGMKWMLGIGKTERTTLPLKLM